MAKASSLTRARARMAKAKANPKTELKEAKVGDGLALDVDGIVGPTTPIEPLMGPGKAMTKVAKASLMVKLAIGSESAPKQRGRE